MDERFQSVLKRIQSCKEKEFEKEFEDCILIALHLFDRILETILHERELKEKEKNKDLLPIREKNVTDNEKSWSKYKKDFFELTKLFADHIRDKLNHIRDNLDLSLDVDLKWYTTLLKSMIDYYNALESQWFELYKLESQMYKTEDEWIKSLRMPRKKPQDVMEHEQKRKDELERFLGPIVFNIKEGKDSELQKSRFEIWKAMSVSKSIDEIEDTKTILKNAINKLSNNYIMRRDEVSNYIYILDEIEELLNLDLYLKHLDDIANTI